MLYIETEATSRAQMGFLSNLVKVFPSLKTRPLYVTGESYAGTYIVRPLVPYSPLHADLSIQPYIMKTYFGLTDPPVNIAKFAIGDGTVGSFEVFELLPTVSKAAYLTRAFYIDHVFTGDYHRDIPPAHWVRPSSIRVLPRAVRITLSFFRRSS